MKILSAKLHGYLDFVTVAIFFVAPTALGLTGLPSVLAYMLAVVHLTMTLLTAYPLGAVKLIPFPLHGWVERIVGPVLLALPFVLGFASNTLAMGFFVVMGLVIVVVGLLTDYRAA